MALFLYDFIYIHQVFVYFIKELVVKFFTCNVIP